MTESPGQRLLLPRLPALDGLRAVALGAVLLFHSDYVWAKGGHLGVTAFFTLSGFLITALLLLERDRTGRIDFVAFWGRRARRLVPAALVCLALVVAYVAASPQLSFDGLLGDAAASVTWFANWRFVADGAAYSDLFSTPSPFQHFWSLAIEEQFYLALPVVAGVVLSFGAYRTRRLRLAVVCIAAIVASTAAAALLHQPGEGALRAYYGTDARIAEPLVGVVLALMLVGPSGLRRFSLRSRRVADTAGVLSLVGLALLASQLSPWHPRLYEGGFLLAAVLAGIVVMAATQRGGIVDRMLSAPILVGIGRVSYGAYLFHWPVYLWMTEQRAGLEGSGLLTARLAVTFLLAAVSYFFIELPIRERRLPVQVGALAWPTATVGLLSTLVVAMALPVPGGGERVSSGFSGRDSDPVTPAQVGGEAEVQAAAGHGTSQHAAAAPAAEAAAAVPAGESPQDPASPEAAPTPTTAPGERAEAIEGEPGLRIAVIGDSLANNLARGFEIWGERSGQAIVANFSNSGCPISRGGTRRFPSGFEWPIREECSWWDDTYSRTFGHMRDFAPDVIVAEDSFANVPDRKLEEWPRYRHAGEPLFDTWLVQEYDAFVDLMESEGIPVVMTNAACADFDRQWPWKSLDDGDERVTALNRRVYPFLTTRVDLADLNARVCPGGEYSDTVEGYEDARPDGFHFRDEVSAALVERWLGPIVVAAAEGG